MADDQGAEGSEAKTALEEMTAIMFAGTTTGSIFTSCAIVGALAQKGQIEPLRVAGLAEWMAENMPPSDMSPEAMGYAKTHVMEFAKLVRAMTTMPTTAGRA